MNSIIKQFNDTPITFNDEGWFNATEAAKAFNKETAQWLRLPGTIEYMAALAESIPVEITGLVATKRGQHGGTWLHPKLGVAFARWLDVRFAVWCDTQIDSIIRGQQTIRADRSALRVEFAPMTDAGRSGNPNDDHQRPGLFLRSAGVQAFIAALDADA